MLHPFECGMVMCIACVDAHCGEVRKLMVTAAGAGSWKLLILVVSVRRMMHNFSLLLEMDECTQANDQRKRMWERGLGPRDQLAGGPAFR